MVYAAIVEITLVHVKDTKTAVILIVTKLKRNAERAHAPKMVSLVVYLMVHAMGIVSC